MLTSTPYSVVIATAIAAANGQNVGDISVIIPQGLADALLDSVETAVDACGGVAGKARRDDTPANIRRQIDAAAGKIMLTYDL